MKQVYYYLLALVVVVSLIYLQRMDTNKAKTPEAPKVSAKSTIPVRPVASKATPTDKALAQKAQPFTLEYAGNSAIKSIPLKNAKLRVKVYYSNNPDGIVTLKTDDKAHFKFNKYKKMDSVVLEIISIDGQYKYNANCYGQTLPGSRKVKVNCSHPAT